MVHVHAHTETGRPEPPAEVALVTVARHRPEPPGPSRAEPRAAGETTPGGDCFSIPTSCADCGACCHSSSQPAIYLLLATRPAFAAIWHDKPDVPRATTLPQEAWDTVCRADPRVMRCCWLDGENRCRWYDHRPEACRRLELGSQACLDWRTKILSRKGTADAGTETITGGAG